MEALKLIPQVFFDLLARVVPGCVALVSYLILWKQTWQAIIADLFGQVFARESMLLSFLIFLGAGFVIGELLSPLAKGVQRINKEIQSFNKEHNKSKNKNKGENDERIFNEKELRYDRLRFEKPEVGALCAKIRAEFTMHNGLAVVFAMDSVCYPYSTLIYKWYVLALLLALTFLIAYRGLTTNETYNDTVAKFAQLLNEKKTGS